MLQLKGIDLQVNALAGNVRELYLILIGCCTPTTVVLMKEAAGDPQHSSIIPIRFSSNSKYAYPTSQSDN